MNRQGTSRSRSAKETKARGNPGQCPGKSGLKWSTTRGYRSEMRIALVLDPAANPMDTSAWLWDALRASRVSLVMLPEGDPLVSALGTALAESPEEDDAVVVLARAATGHVAAEDWQRLGFADRARLSGSRTDSAIELALANASGSRSSLDAATLAELHRHQLHAAKTSQERGKLWSQIAD
jgi:hypothetical protein